MGSGFGYPKPYIQACTDRPQPRVELHGDCEGKRKPAVEHPINRIGFFIAIRIRKPKIVIRLVIRSPQNIGNY